MRSPLSIMLDRRLIFVVLLLALAGAVLGQTTAIVTPEKSPLDLRIVAVIRANLFETMRMQDVDMTTAAFDSAKPETPFNMTTDEARTIGSVIGTDIYALVRSGTQRRAAIGRPDYYEAFAAVYFISSRTGRLVLWQMITKEGSATAAAQEELIRTMPALVFDLVRSARAIAAQEVAEPTLPAIEEIPAAASPAAKDFRAPVPYRRLKPEYTRAAYLYDLTATVEATVDLDEKGNILRAVITRWAGFGLDESVLAVIKRMKWRPAERNGKPLPIRFLLRYNFKKLEKDDSTNE